MALYALGDVDFVVFRSATERDGPPEILSEQTLPVMRPGVDGAGILRLGKQGKPFQMHSGVDLVGMDGVNAERWAYDEMIGSQRFDLWWNDTDFTEEFLTQYLVAAVAITKIKRLSIAVG